MLINGKWGVVGAGFLKIPLLEQIILRLNPPVQVSGVWQKSLFPADSIHDVSSSN